MIRILCHVLMIFAFWQFSSAHGESYVGHQRLPEFSVVTHPKDVVAEKEGRDVVMDCRDEGPLRANVIWTSPDGDVLPTGVDGRLILNGVRPVNAGRYECSVPIRKRKGSFFGNATKNLVLVVEPFASRQCEEAHARCRSGECVPHKHFCDQRAHCADRSDEFKCNLARKRSLAPRRPRFGYYPEDESSCRPISWTQCNKKCKQYGSCSEGRRPRLHYRRYCTNPEAPCAGVTIAATWSEWSEWTQCSRTCGEAIQQRTRTCKDPTGRARCEGLPAEQRPCGNIPCPIDGEWSEWTEWTLCTELGYRSRERQCDSPPPLHGGKDCAGVYRETQECHTCSSTVHLKLSPGRVQCTVGRPTTFVCEYCSDDADSNLKIDMDTEPETSKGTHAHDNMHAQSWSGPCLRRAWTLKLNNDHHRVSCILTDSGNEVVGKVISTIKIKHEGLQLTYAECHKDQFTCKDKRCIDNSRFCDGYRDCADGADEEFCPHVEEPVDYPESEESCDPSYERFCPTTNLCIPESLITGGWGANWDTGCGRIVTGKSECQNGQFSCASRQCWTKNCQCDGVNDCGDWSDEVGCQYIGAPERQPTLTLTVVPRNRSQCYPEQIRCRTSHTCILRTQVCDGKIDCEDGSDEEPGCNARVRNGRVEPRFTTRMADVRRPAAPVCRDHEFLCDKTKCLDWAVNWCDGTKDCEDGSDEDSCKPKAAGANCTEMQFTCANQQCIPLHMYCDSMEDCVDNTDEVEDCVRPKIKDKCKSGEYKCSSVAVCIAKERNCDGKKDCPDASDENNCPTDDVKTNEIRDSPEHN